MIEKFQKFLDLLAQSMFLRSFQNNEQKISADTAEKDRLVVNSPSPFSELEKSTAKRKFFERSLEKGVTTLYLDPRVSGVIVPDKFCGLSVLVLNYSYGYRIDDFFFNDEIVVASLSFSGRNFRCTVPWSSVHGIASQSDGIFCSFGDISENEAKEILGTKEEKHKEQHEIVKEFSTKNGKSRLRLIKGEK